MWKSNRTKSTSTSATTTTNNSLKSVFTRLSGSKSIPDRPSPSRSSPPTLPQRRAGGDERQEEPILARDRERTVLVHFMLGNTYPYTPTTWKSTLDLIYETGIDGVVFNLGSEGWQVDQVRSALNVLETSPSFLGESEGGSEVAGGGVGGGLKAILSVDMNVLPSSTQEDMFKLIDIVIECMRSGRYMTTQFPRTREMMGVVDGKGEAGMRGRPILSTFGGHGCSFGGKGWTGFLEVLKEKGFDVFFIPSFFLPPDQVLGNPLVNGAFNWNGAWPMGDYPTSMIEDLPFIQHKKPYMAAVSPWFFTHYGTVGEWAWNKNWIYRSDDHLYASRWLNIIRPEFDPDLVQIISWNDFGESHYIGPIVGAEPGSQSWTRGMPHEGWRKMTEWFIRRYKKVPLELETETRVYLTYRLQSKDCLAEQDKIGRPDRADFAQDVISILITTPRQAQRETRMILTIDAGHMNTHDILLEPKDGVALALVPFIPGPVAFQLLLNDKVVLQGQGPPIANDVSTTTYNFNAWTGTWGTLV